MFISAVIINSGCVDVACVRANTNKLRLLLLLATSYGWSQTTVLLRPTADGTVKQWTNNAGTACTSATCYTEVNETTGTTNCSGNQYVSASGVVNKSPATATRDEDYVISLASIPNGAIIDSGTVRACAGRGGSQNATSYFMFILNGGTTQCSGANTWTATFSNANCVFSPLSVTKSDSTTLQIGMRTNQNRSVWLDSIAVSITYHLLASGPVTASAHFVPAVTAVKTHPVALSVGLGVNPGSPTGVGAPAQTRAGTATITYDSPCCALVSSPLNATVHFGVSVSAGGVVSTPAAAAFGISPIVTGERGAGSEGQIAIAFSYDAPVCALVRSTLKNQTVIHFTDQVTAETATGKNGPVMATVGFSPTVTATPPGEIVGGGIIDFTLDSPVCASVWSSLKNNTVIHFSDVATATGGSAKNGYTTSGLHVDVTCLTCKGKWFQAATIHIDTYVTGSRGIGGSTGTEAVASFGTSPVPTYHVGLHSYANQTLSASTAAIGQAPGYGLVTEGFGTTASAGINVTLRSSVNVAQSFALATDAQESAESSNGSIVALRVSTLATTLHSFPTPDISDGFHIAVAAKAVRMGRQTLPVVVVN